MPKKVQDPCEGDITARLFLQVTPRNKLQRPKTRGTTSLNRKFVQNEIPAYYKIRF
jgi:hypothetical protein